MEVTEDNLGPVHASRQSLQYDTRHTFKYAFEASENLHETLGQFIRPGVTHSRSLLYATRLVSIDTLHYPIEEINIEYELARRAFMQHGHDRLELGGVGRNDNRVAGRRLHDGSLQLGILPRDESAFGRLISGFDTLPVVDEAHNSDKPTRHFLSYTVPASALNEKVYREAMRQFSQDLASSYYSRYYTVSPSGIDRAIQRMEPPTKAIDELI